MGSHQGHAQPDDSSLRRHRYGHRLGDRHARYSASDSDDRIGGAVGSHVGNTTIICWEPVDRASLARKRTLVFLARPVPQLGRNARPKPLSQFFMCFPSNMIVLPSVKMEFL